MVATSLTFPMLFSLTKFWNILRFLVAAPPTQRVVIRYRYRMPDRRTLLTRYLAIFMRISECFSSVSSKPGVSIRCTLCPPICVVAISISFVPLQGSQEVSQVTIMYLQDFRPCPISIFRPVILLIKIVFPAPVMPITAIRIDFSVKVGGWRFDLRDQSRPALWLWFSTITGLSAKRNVQRYLEVGGQSVYISTNQWSSVSWHKAEMWLRSLNPHWRVCSECENML